MRRLALARERLAELTPAELLAVAGGVPPTHSCPMHTERCLTGDYTTLISVDGPTLAC